MNEEALRAWMDAEATRRYTPTKDGILCKAKDMRMDARTFRYKLACFVKLDALLHLKIQNASLLQCVQC